MTLRPRAGRDQPETAVLIDARPAKTNQLQQWGDSGVQSHFDSVEAFQAAFAPRADAIMGDIANYTDAQPIVQIGEVRL
jgi:uncharacterized protein (TIGR02118 family)